MGMGIQDWLAAFCPRLTRKVSASHWSLRWWQGVETVATGGSYLSVREFLYSGAGWHWGMSLQDYKSRIIVSHSRSGADRETALGVLTVTTLSSVGFVELELSVSPALDVIDRSDMKGMEVKEKLSFCRGRCVENCVRPLCLVVSRGLLWFLGHGHMPS